MPCQFVYSHILSLHLCVGHQHHAYELGHLARLKLFCYALKTERKQFQAHNTRIEIIF